MLRPGISGTTRSCAAPAFHAHTAISPGFRKLISSRVCPLLGSLGRLCTVSTRVGPCVLLQMLSVCESVQGTLSSLWQIPFAAPAGGSGKTAILSLWFREAVAYQETIPHPNMPSVEFPFGIFIRGKELPWKMLLFCSPSPQKGNLQALLLNWRPGPLERDTFVGPPSLALGGGGLQGAPLPTRGHPWGSRAGPRGKGSSGDLGGSPDQGARTPEHLRLRCAPRPEPQMDHSPQINK